MKVSLIAVQTQLDAANYRSAEAFKAYVLNLCLEAVTGTPSNQAKVLAFPEAFTLPLLFWLETPDEIVESKTSLQAALLLLKQNWREALRLAIPSPSVFYHLRSKLVWPLYQEAFQTAAQKTGAYIFAGSIFSPLMDWEPSRQLHRESWRVHNISLVVSPQGTVLGRVPKVNLTAHERAAFLSSGPLGQQTISTRIGRLSNLICLDAFHDNLIEQADAAGAWLVVQPSANAAAWNGPWSGENAQIEGEVWLREGLAQKLLGRENLRYGINPMLNGKLYDLEFEGRSGVYAAGKTLSLAESHLGNEIVRAEVTLHPDE